MAIGKYLIALLGLVGCREEVNYNRLRGRGSTYDMKRPRLYDGGSDHKLRPDAEGDASTLDARVHSDAPYDARRDVAGDMPQPPLDGVADVPQRADGFIPDAPRLPDVAVLPPDAPYIPPDAPPAQGDSAVPSPDIPVLPPDAPPRLPDVAVLPPDAGVIVVPDAPPRSPDVAVLPPDAGVIVVPDAPPDRGLDGLIADAGVPNLTDFRRPYDCDSNTILLHQYNDGAPFVDSCGSNDAVNNGTVRVEGRSVEFGQARQCSVDGYLSVPDNDLLSPGGDGSFTVEAWIRPTAYSPPGSVSYIVSRHGATSGSHEWFLYLDSAGKLAGGKFADCETTSERSVIGPAVIPLDTWTHIALRYNGATNTLDLLVNGVVDNTSTPLPPTGVCPSGSADLTICRAGDGSLPFEGDIDGVRYSRIAREF